ncbi:MAG: prepilin peptidase [Acidimicrobiales bacterium]
MEPTNPTGLLAAAEHTGRDRLVAAIGVAGAVAVFLSHRATPVTAVGLVVVVAVSTWLSIIDFREHRLPNQIVGPLAVAVTVAVIVGSLIEDDLWRGGRAVGFGLAVTAILLLANVLGGMGMGDVKYGFPWATTIGWFGWPPLSIAIMVTTISGALVAVAVLIGRRSGDESLSYGPYMALGLIGGLLAAAL